MPYFGLRHAGLRSVTESTLRFREAELLQIPQRSAGDPVSREALLKQVWGVASVGTRTLDTHITRLRKKLERDPAHPQHIQTVHGVGYRLQP